MRRWSIGGSFGWMIFWLLGTGATGAAASELTLRGQVQDDAGRPLAGAQIELRPVHGLHNEGLRTLQGEARIRPSAQSRSSRQGAFELIAPEIGLWRVTVTADGRVPMTRLLRPLLSEEALSPVRLLSAEAVTVSVITEGSPITGARVDVHTPQDFEPWQRAWTEGRWWPDRRWALTDDAGQVTLSVAGQERPRIEAFKTGFKPADATSNDSGRLAQLIASPERRLRFLDADGQPVAGVLLLDDRRPLAVSAEDGSLRITAAYLERRPPRLIVSRSNGYQVTLTHIPADQTDVRLLPGHEVSGRVTDADGQPIAGAIVWRDRGPASALHTDARGQFRWQTAEQRLFLGIGADGYQAKRHTVTATPVDLDITLDPAASMAGRVVDADGLPLAGVRIRVRQANLHAASWNRRYGQVGDVLTADDGGFRLSGLPAGDPLEILAQQKGHAPAAMSATAGPESQDLEIVLQHGHAVVGQVVDVDGQPIASAAVRLFHQPALGEARLEIATGELLSAPKAITDAEGRFTVANLPTGTHGAEVRHPNFAPRTLNGVQAPNPEGSPGDPVDLGTLVLEVAVALEVRVVDPDGQPIADVHVALARRVNHWRPSSVHRPTENLRQKTNDRGFLRQDQLQAGDRFDLHLTHPAYVDAQLQAVEVPTEEPLEIVLQPGARISGVVVGSDGHGVAQARVEAGSEIKTENAFGSSSRTTYTSQTTDAEGRFELRGIHPGEVRLATRVAGYAEEALLLRLTEGEHRDGVRLELRRGATISGRVLDSVGRAVAGGEVSLRHKSSPHTDRAASATTDAEGRFRLGDRPLGPIEISVRHPEHGAAELDLELVSGDNPVEITLSSSRLVAGRVLNTSGQPLARAQVKLSWFSDSGSGSMSSETLADGTFSLLPPRAGDFELSADHESWRRVRRPITVGEEPLTGLELVLPEGVRISGTVLGIAPEERNEVIILIQPIFDPESTAPYISQPPYRVIVDVQGQYRAAGLAPGRWQLEGTMPHSARRAQATVSISEGEIEIFQDLEFTGGDLRLTGVVMAGGKPVAGAPVSVTSPKGSHVWAVAGNDGRFRLRDLEPGKYTLRVTSDGGQIQEEVELWSDRDLQIHLDSSSILE